MGQPYIEMKCGLGEAPFYETNTHCLRFVDIVKRNYVSWMLTKVHLHYSHLILVLPLGMPLLPEVMQIHFVDVVTVRQRTSMALTTKSLWVLSMAMRSRIKMPKSLGGT